MYALLDQQGCDPKNSRALRQRQPSRYRERTRCGRVVVRLELDADTIEKLEGVSTKLGAVDVGDPQYLALLAAAAQAFFFKK